MVEIEGVDYRTTPPGSAALRAAGKKFVVRYLAHDSRGITPAELRELTAGGIDVAVVYESTENRASEGRDAGRADAARSQTTLTEAGLPKGMPIYFAVDFDASEDDQAAIDEYLRGAAEVIGANRIGVYGGYFVCKRCRDNGTARWLWQTYAWSGGNVLDGIHLYQYNNFGQNINGTDVDLTRALQENYGQASRVGRDWPEGMDLGLARRWYGRRTTPEGTRQFAEDAEECLLWKRLGRFPRLLAIDRFDTREYLRFSDGIIIWRPNEREHYRVMDAGGPDGDFPGGMDASLARRWFGRVTAGERTYHFSPTGAVSRVWLAGGQFARLVAVEEAETARYYVFANGMVIWRPTPGTAPALLAGTAGGTMPAGLTEERAARWFGSTKGVSYDTHDSVRRPWLSLGRFPALAAVERYDERTYLRFADGSVIWRPNDAAAFRLLG